MAINPICSVKTECIIQRLCCKYYKNICNFIKLYKLLSKYNTPKPIKNEILPDLNVDAIPFKVNSL